MEYMTKEETAQRVADELGVSYNHAIRDLDLLQNAYNKGMERMLEVIEIEHEELVKNIASCMMPIFVLGQMTDKMPQAKVLATLLKMEAARA